jgi:hypothetical protein
MDCHQADVAQQAGKFLSRLRSKTILLADRGYDADWIRAPATKKGAWGQTLTFRIPTNTGAFRNPIKSLRAGVL